MNNSNALSCFSGVIMSIRSFFLFVNALLSEIYCGNTRSLPTEFITDSQSLVDALKSSKYVSDKRLRTEFVKEMVENK